MELRDLYTEGEHNELNQYFTEIERAIAGIFLAMHDIGDDSASEKLLEFRKEFKKYASATSILSADLLLWCGSEDPHVIADSIKGWEALELED